MLNANLRQNCQRHYVITLLEHDRKIMLIIIARTWPQNYVNNYCLLLLSLGQYTWNVLQILNNVYIYVCVCVSIYIYIYYNNRIKHLKKKTNKLTYKIDWQPRDKHLESRPSLHNWCRGGHVKEVHNQMLQEHLCRFPMPRGHSSECNKHVWGVLSKT